MDDPELIGQIVLAMLAVIALCALQPRWDMGHGALLIVLCVCVGWPVWAPVLWLGMIGFVVWIIGCAIFYPVRGVYRWARSG